MLEPDPPEKIATQRVLNDDTLQPGEIVSTDKGLLLFRGRSAPDGQTAEFAPIGARRESACKIDYNFRAQILSRCSR
jgi:hypothetical protein